MIGFFFSDGEGEAGDRRAEKETLEASDSGGGGVSDEETESERGGNPENREIELGAGRASTIAVQRERDMARYGADERSQRQCSEEQSGAGSEPGEDGAAAEPDQPLLGLHRSGVGGGGGVVLREHKRRRLRKKRQRRGREGKKRNGGHEHEKLQELQEGGGFCATAAVQAPLSLHKLRLHPPYLPHL